MTTQPRQTEPNRTTAVGLMRYAVEYMEAALAVVEKRTKSGYEIIAPVPAMFLVGQAVELALKAYLLQMGVSLVDIRKKYGHQLHRSLRKAKELDLLSYVQIMPEEEYGLDLLNDLYASKRLQYIVTGAATFPMFIVLEKVALKLIYAIGRIVGFIPRTLPKEDEFKHVHPLCQDFPIIANSVLLYTNKP
jgi:HEPN domain-containing protein